jgi:LruC domain-containing protein
VKKFISILSVCCLVVAGCKKENATSGNTAAIADNFDFRTSRRLEVDITVRDLQGLPLQGVRVDFYDRNPEVGGELFSAGFTDEQGRVETYIKIPTYFETVFVKCHFQGFSNEKEVSAVAPIAINFGGVPAMRNTPSSVIPNNQRTWVGANVYYTGGFSPQGVPTYLLPVKGLSTQDLLQDVNASLPETKDVALYHPDYLNPLNDLDLDITSTNEVFVTFLGEGTIRQNALGYFVYNTANPPSSKVDIDSIFLIFPNTSLVGSGGNLQAGDQVSLGVFGPGKSIGWVLLQDAWDASNRAVNPSQPMLFSRPTLNPEGIALGQHSVQLIDSLHNVRVIGFEDKNRTSLTVDHDFNDVLFQVKTTTVTGVRRGRAPKLKGKGDKDGDGVPDVQDEYPLDPARAANILYAGSLGFEDLWPVQGDYDFNDLVISYGVTHVVNAKNLVVDIKGGWTIRAVGAGFNNGFGWEFPYLTPGEISSVTGTSLTGNLINLNGNGTEAGLNTATIIAWDQTFSQIQGSGGAFINTVKTDPRTEEVTKQINLSLVEPKSVEEVGLPPYNPFIFVDGDRSKEVHLSGHQPTGKADQKLFGVADDDSNPAKGRYYKNQKNMPWAIHIYGHFDYPEEYAAVSKAYTKFSAWAASNGLRYPDWYLNVPGYRNKRYIY